MGCIKTKNPIKLLPNSISQEMENNDNSIMAPSEIKNKVNEKNKEKFLSNSNNINLQHLTDMSQSIKIKAIIPENPRKAEENYKVICKLGKGSFGSVYKVIYIKSSNIRAMKVIKKSSINYQDDERIFLKEIEILAKTEHPNIIKIIEYYKDEINYYIITEYISGGELYEAISKCNKFNESKAAYIMRQILSALNYLHSFGIVHRDIKPENMLVEKSSDEDLINIKLIDFGTSNYVTEKKNLTLKVGSPYYIAPEVLKKNYGKKCDIWSAGIILYIMLIGKLPFHGKNTEELFNNIKKGVFDKTCEEWNSISNNAKDLILKMLEYNPEKRFSAQECLDHTWIKTLASDTKSNLIPGVLKNIYNLNAREKLQQATIAYIVHNLNSNKEIEELKKVFQSMDLNNDGMLNYNEIKTAFQKYFGVVSEVKINKIIEEMDNNSDGIISYEEFLRVAVNQSIFLDEKNLRLAFDMFDINKDGKLSREELKQVLDTSNFKYIDILIQIIDNNKDGFISFEEFCQLMKNVGNNIIENENKKKIINNDINDNKLY
jgi:calcium-dependent protein kinase